MAWTFAHVTIRHAKDVALPYLVGGVQSIGSRSQRTNESHWRFHGFTSIQGRNIARDEAVS